MIKEKRPPTLSSSVHSQRAEILRQNRHFPQPWYICSAISIFIIIFIIIDHHHDRKYLAHALFRKLPSHGGSIYPKKIFFANITFKFKDLRSPTGSNKFLKFYACLFIRSSPLLKASIEECHRSMINSKKTSPLRFTSKVLTVFNSIPSTFTSKF